MIIATAGHIDHGKTSLVRALTGADTDRLPEERKRGISIDLGFAHWRPAPGVEIGFVDVPGHERFIRNMLAGVAGADFALVVIAADDGVMPQTLEHVQILDLMGFERGAIAITKADRVTGERIAEVRAQASRMVEGTTLEGIPVVDLSSATGAGVAELARLLIDAASLQTAAANHGRNFRMAVDRVFTVAGAGTVVTGTILSGEVSVGDRLVIAPAGTDVRVRGVQRGGVAATSGHAGERCALNLAGADTGEVRRGDWLTVRSMNAPTARMQARLKVLAGRDRPLRHGTPVHVHIGTADLPARVLTTRQAPIPAGSSAFAQLAFDVSAVASAGDRFVVRDQSGRQLIGGGRIVIPDPPPRRRRSANQEMVLEALDREQAGDALNAWLGFDSDGIDADAIARWFNLSPDAADRLVAAAPADRIDGMLFARSLVARVRETAIAALAEFHRAQPEAAAMPVRALHRDLRDMLSQRAFGLVLRILAKEGCVEATASAVKLPGHAPSFSPYNAALWQKLLPMLEERGPRPFTAADLARESRLSEAALQAVLHGRRSSRDIWRINKDQFMLGEHVAGLAEQAARLTAETGPDGFTAAQYRDRSGIGRNLTIKLLEFFDSIGVTARRGDRRWTVPAFADIVGASANADA